MRIKIYILLILGLLACTTSKDDSKAAADPFLLVLGVAQDAGYPQLACSRACCNLLTKDQHRMVSSIAIVDPISNESWMFDATPDFTAQSALLAKHLQEKRLPDGIFLTHGHMGHYTGLMYLGREVLNADRMPVFGMPRMRNYLKNNGPWSQLITLNNIELKSLKADSLVVLNDRISVTPFIVPHRDEFTETVGYLIHSRLKKALFIPDIDKWSKWDTDIRELIKQVDIALLDATFYKDGEINRDMSEVPHPFVEESMALFSELEPADKAKIYFIHFNHTNPLLNEKSQAQQWLNEQGFKSAKQEMIISFE